MADDQVVERKLAVIFAADVAEYSRLMGLDEVGTLRTLQAYRAILDRMIATHHGRIFNTAGDSVMADFASPVDAVECAVAVQEAIDKENTNRAPGGQPAATKPKELRSIDRRVSLAIRFLPFLAL